jgi:uncharacterized membrane protein
MDHVVPDMRNLDRPSIGIKLTRSTPLDWLALGWRDLTRSPVASIAYGLIFFAVGYVLLGLSAGRPYLFLGAVSGFFLIAPLLLAGVYEISRRKTGERVVGFFESLSAWRDNRHSLADFGLVLVFVTLCWQMLSALLFAFHYVGAGDYGDVTSLANSLFVSGASLGFLASYMLLGGVLAALVFAISAVSVPLLMDRKVDVVTAMITSVSAVRANLPIMMVWAALIVLLAGIGFATMMVGLIVIVPLLGHATWHAYKALVE